VTFPALTGLTLSVPWLCEIAEPLSVSLRVGLEAFEVIETLPLKLPADCGAKVTLKDVLCPGVNVKGVLIPEILKPVPAAET
jgi:hypothetical protein